MSDARKGYQTARFIGLFVLVSLLATISLQFVYEKTATANPQSIMFAIGQDRYRVDGQAYSMDAATFIESGRTFVPVRYLGNALGIPDQDIQWDPSARTVTIDYNGIDIVLTVGSQILRVNNQQRSIDVAPLIQNGRTFLPARYVAEILGYSASYDQATNTVTLNYTGNTANTGNNTVVIQNFMFNPGTLTISVGQTVTWVNQDNVDHTVTALDAAFASGPRVTEALSSTLSIQAGPININVLSILT